MWGWNDGIGGLVWGGAVARLLIWCVLLHCPIARAVDMTARHTTFCINSLAHWTGLQPYTEEVTARGNYVSPRPHPFRRVTQGDHSCSLCSPQARVITSELPKAFSLVPKLTFLGSFHHAFPKDFRNGPHPA